MPRIVNAYQSEKSYSVGIYGPAGSGKTRLACTVNRHDPFKWGEKSVYIAVDRGSSKLSSVLPLDKENLVTFVLGDEAGKAYDPYDEVCKIADSLRKDQLGCGTVILDTATVLARDMLQAVANSGKYSDKHIMIVANGPGKLAMAMPGDYGATQQGMFNIFRAFENLPMNFICLFHDGLVEPDGLSNFPAYGGPATAGKGAINPVAGWFDNLIRTEARTSGVGKEKKTEYIVHTEKNGPYMAKLRMASLTNPIPTLQLDPDPINFWKKFEEVTN